MLSSSCSSRQCSGHVIWTEDREGLYCDACGRKGFTTSYKERRNRATAAAVEIINKLKNLKKQNGNEEILEVYGQFNEMWNGVLHPTNIYVTQLLDHAFDASINLNKWEDALKYGESTVKAYRMYYPEFHPALGIQLMKIGKIHLHLLHDGESSKYLRQAEDILQVTHGTDSQLFKELKELQYQCQNGTESND